MKALLALTLISLAFATGFTCSKQTPPEVAPAAPAPSQEQMAAPPAADPVPATPSVPTEEPPPAQ